ncbi:hypothetical protein NJLHNGOC_09065 [Novacetimonas cocois]|uniref:Uncharacterized protein n=1 Tax=Novacetimonas cocois TaxID=1747507 RepID=A0A365YUT8_9PROT|nr:hypothetical protein NJLHNGOC_09065 [Novacetimonas cocois]
MTIAWHSRAGRPVRSQRAPQPRVACNGRIPRGFSGPADAGLSRLTSRRLPRRIDYTGRLHPPPCLRPAIPACRIAGTGHDMPGYRDAWTVPCGTCAMQVVIAIFTALTTGFANIAPCDPPFTLRGGRRAGASQGGGGVPPFRLTEWRGRRPAPYRKRLLQ